MMYPMQKKTLNNLFKRDLVYIREDYIVNLLIYFLYERYKDTISKIFIYISNDDIYRICSLFMESNNLEAGLEVFRFII